MTVYGVTNDGFVPQTTDIIRSEMETDLRFEFFRSLPLGDKTLLGHLVGMISERLGKLWEIAEMAFSMMDPDKAFGAMLRALCLLTGTFAKGATSSVVAVTLCGDDGTLVPTGNVVNTDSTGQGFELIADATIVALDAWAPSTSYLALARVTNSGNCYQCTTSGISAGSGGPTSSDPTDDITDNEAHWQYIGTGTGAVDAIYAATETGEVFAAALDLIDIQNPVGGLNTALNLADASLGAPPMSDQALRLLREAEISRAGTGTPDAVRTALLDIDTVTAATVFFNNTEVVDGNGLPPKTCMCLVQGGDDQDIWQVLWDNVPLGIRTLGPSIGFVTDSQGTIQTLRFRRPTLVPIYIAIHVEVDTTIFPADGEDQIKQSIATFGDLQPPGKNAVARQLGAQAFAVYDQSLQLVSGVPGVDDVPHCYISVAPTPTLETTIQIDLFSIATFDTGNIAVTVVDATP